MSTLAEYNAQAKLLGMFYDRLSNSFYTAEIGSTPYRYFDRDTLEELSINTVLFRRKWRHGGASKED